VKRALKSIAAAIALAAVVTWALTGANRGWTKTSIEVKTIDPVTEIEGISYRPGFRPGIDFLAAGLALAVILGGISLLYKNRPAGHKK
jgi:hypothetical protein